MATSNAEMSQDDHVYYKKLLRHLSNHQDSIVASKPTRMNRNCFFSPVQCMLTQNTIIGIRRSNFANSRS
ncbi:unnamed protein product [Auanema sp. JU1783]|nr:unnamed protein product [Auanema sp. JU1783]